MHRRRALLTVLLLALLTLATGCTGGDPEPAGPPGAPDLPGATGGPSPPGPDGWQVRAPEDRGMDPGTLAEARDYAFADGMHTQGVVVVRGGAIVAEWYAQDADAGSWAASWSMAKSVTGALIGIAIEEGHIPSVDEPVVTYYPEWEGTPREDITLRHLLQMTSGLDFDADGAFTETVRMVATEADQLAFAAGRPLLRPAGTAFHYSNGDAQLLSGVLAQATGMSAGEYARQVLFDPLGIGQVEWWQDAGGSTLTYCCLDTTSRDFARFGQLYLRDGAWGDEQVVPADWVADSVAPSEASGAYGHMWWLATGDDLPPDMYSARGFDDQYLYVVPSLDLVVVRNSTYHQYDGEAVADPNLFDKYPNSIRPRDDLGTRAPAGGWDEAAFLRPIIDSILEPEGHP